jgi:hypothetical protein
MLLAMTLRGRSITPPSRDSIRPSFANSFAPKDRGRREDRVRAAPAVSCAKICMAKRTRAYRFSGSSPAFPAQWFYGLYRALPGETWLVYHRRMARNKQVIWVNREARYFCKRGWTQHRVICLAGKINPVISANRNVILRCELLRASKDGHTHDAEHHPSRRVEDDAHLGITVPLLRAMVISSLRGAQRRSNPASFCCPGLLRFARNNGFISSGFSRLSPAP